MNDHSGGTEPLLSLAHSYALDAISEAERSDIDARLRLADSKTREAFAAIVAEVQATMARLADATATPPPPGLRDRILNAIDHPKEPPTGDS